MPGMMNVPRPGMAPQQQIPPTSITVINIIHSLLRMRGLHARASHMTSKAQE